MLVIAYVYFGDAPAAGPTAATSLDAERTAGFTSCLLASSVTV